MGWVWDGMVPVGPAVSWRRASQAPGVILFHRGSSDDEATFQSNTWVRRGFTLQTGGHETLSAPGYPLSPCAVPGWGQGWAPLERKALFQRKEKSMS